MRNLFRNVFAGMLLAGSALLLSSACSSDEAPATASTCTLNTDCSSNLVCSFGKCHVECRGTKDCRDGRRCVNAGDVKVCQLAEEAKCTGTNTGSTCVAPLRCGSDGQCRNECASSGDCVTGQECTKDGVCAEPGEVNSLGGLKNGTDGGADASASGGGPGTGGTGSGGTSGSGGRGDGSVSTGGTSGSGGRGSGGASGGTGGSDASVGTPDASGGAGNSETCPTGLPGRKMIKVSAPVGGGAKHEYCIDSTEVTACDYEAFLASSPSKKQIVGCAWNTDFTPDNTNYCLGAYDPANHPNIPIRCADWCDAYAYCSWAGKELCGAVDGGPRPWIENIADGAWGNACSESGKRTFPYGNTLDTAACIVGPDAPPAEVKDVASTPTCEGGFAGVFDMGGNVAEWENACDGDTGPGNACEVRGGSFAMDPGAAACNEIYSSSGQTRRDLKADFVGFRCCAQPVKPGADSGRDPTAPVPGAFCPGAAAEPEGRDGGPFKPRGCPAPLHGSALVEVPAPRGSPVESYCVDAKEATYTEYEAFIAGNYPTTGQRSECTWNDTYIPGCNWPTPTGREQFPVGCVDWCDADAFCAWSGKRLCGKVGGGAAPLIQTALPIRELLNACTKGGTQSYPYGNLYDARACNGNDYDGTGYQGTEVPMAVGTLSSCAGPYPGLYDMVGNAAEWEDACNGTAGSSDGCVLRGGGFQDNTAFTRCGGLASTGRSNHVWDIGIRCCSPSL